MDLPWFALVITVFLNFAELNTTSVFFPEIDEICFSCAEQSQYYTTSEVVESRDCPE